MGLGRWVSRSGVEHGSADSGSGVQLTEWSDFESRALRGAPVDRLRASGLPGVGRGVDLICTVVASLVPQVVRNLFDPLAPVEVLPTPQVLLDPDPTWHGATTWQSAVIADLCWDGNAFADKTRAVDRLGYPTRLPLVGPGRVTWELSSTRQDERVYVVGPDPNEPGTVASQRLEMDPGELMHVAVNVSSGERMGRGILHRYQDTLKLIAAVEQATWVVMRDGQPVGVLSMDVDMTEQELRDAKAAFVSGVRSDGIAALVRAEFAKVGWNANDLALIPARQHNLRLASDVTGLSPYLLGVPSESRVYSNTESEWAHAIRITFNRYLNPLADALSLCVPRGQWVRFDTDDLARPDAGTRWANWKTAAEIGAMTIGEIRQEERLGPMPEQPASTTEEAA